MRHLISSAALLALCAPLAACGTGTAAPQPPTSGQQPSGELPDSIPVPEGEVTTRAPVTVLDDGDGAELCLGGVAESLPPQCGGPPIVGWDWADHEGDYDEAGGTRWGDFVVTGTFDGNTITPNDVVPAAEYEAPPGEAEDRFTTPCPEPPGGWVVDPGRVTMADFEAGMRTAGRLDDHAGSFVDTSPDPRTAEEMDQELAEGNDDVSRWIVNVAVTEDPAAAEAAIREVWGGGVCVTTGTVTQRELRRIQRALSDADVPGFLSSGVDADAVHLGVVHDDGSIQRWADQEFGEGLVVVSSALVEQPPS